MNALLPLFLLARRHSMESRCRWTRARVEQHQARSARELRSYVYAQSPFYQRFHRGLEDRPLSELPVLTKAMLMEHFDELVTDRAIRLSDAEAHLAQDSGRGFFLSRYIVLATSGSTGRRGVFPFSKKEWISVLALITRPMAWAGAAPSLTKRTRAALVGSTVPWHYSSRVSQSLTTRFFPSLRLDATEPLERMVEQLNSWQPEVMGAYPSLLPQLAGEQIAGRLHIPVKLLATSAEVLTEDTRRRALEAWGTNPYNTYGATEFAPIAAECAERRMHLSMTAPSLKS